MEVFETYKVKGVKLMKNKKEIVFLIKVMSGGGAERVVTLLSAAFAEIDYSVTIILTHQNLSDADLTNTDSRINIISLPDELCRDKCSDFAAKLIMLYARILDKLSKVFVKTDSEKASVLKYYSRNYSSVKWLKKYFKCHKTSSVVAFLYDSIFLSLLARTKTNRLVISERSDPQQSASKKTVAAFMNREFPKADAVVFQSPDAQKWYENNTPVKGSVIFNPVKSDLPPAYSGERKKRIVNFCRISASKNLTMLVDAFAKFNTDFPEFELDIFGDPVGDLTEGYLELVEERIRALGCNEKINIFPARNDIHSAIVDYSMFVSSSDFEGMSNSMLEAMAIGLPCVCTDCPAGGARAIIKNGVNGLLVPVGDSEKLCLAMKSIVENSDLSQKISRNAVKIRKDLAVKEIVKKWMEIIDG